MPRQHPITKDPRKAKIDSDIRLGMKLRELSAKYGYSTSSLDRYKQLALNLCKPTLAIEAEVISKQESGKSNRAKNPERDESGKIAGKIDYLLGSDIGTDLEILRNLIVRCQELIEISIAEPDSINAATVLLIREVREIVKVKIHTSLQLKADQREDQRISDLSYAGNSQVDEWNDALMALSKKKIGED